MVVSIHGCEFHAAVRLVDLDAFVLQRHGEAEFLLSIRRVAAQRLRNGQIAHVQRVGHRRRHASRSGIARGNGSGLVGIRRRVAVLAVVRLAHFIARAFRQAGEGDGFAAFERDGLLLLHRLPVDGSGERHAFRRGEFHRNVKGFKRVRRACSVSGHNLLDGKVAYLALVGQLGDNDRHSILDRACRAAGLDKRIAVFVDLVKLGHRLNAAVGNEFLNGIACACRDALNGNRLVAVEGNSCHAARYGEEERAGLSSSGRSVFTIHSDAVMHKRETEGEHVVLACSASGHGLLNRQAAGGTMVGYGNAGGILIANARGADRSLVRADGRYEAILRVIRFGHFIPCARGQSGEGNAFTIFQRKGLAPLRALRG